MYYFLLRKTVSKDALATLGKLKASDYKMGNLKRIGPDHYDFSNLCRKLMVWLRAWEEEKHISYLWVKAEIEPMFFLLQQADNVVFAIKVKDSQFITNEQLRMMYELERPTTEETGQKDIFDPLSKNKWGYAILESVDVIAKSPTVCGFSEEEISCRKLWDQMQEMQRNKTASKNPNGPLPNWQSKNFDISTARFLYNYPITWSDEYLSLIHI